MKMVFLSGGAREKTLRYLFENGEDIIGVVTPRLTKGNRRFEEVITTAVEYGAPVYPVTRNGTREVLQHLKPALLISCGFPYLLDKETIACSQFAINVHPTLLPKYRGYRSGPFILINNERETGVTIHFLDEEMDHGNILVQGHVRLNNFDTPKSMYRKCQAIEGPLLLKAIRLLTDGKTVGVPQDESQASEYKQLRKPSDSEIDPTKPLLELYHQIRACDPDDYPAFFFVDGQKVCIRLWRPNKSDDEQDLI